MRRYSEFVELAAQIQRIFPDFAMPSLPKRRLLEMMTEGQLQKRRAGLELWLEGT